MRLTSTYTRAFLPETTIVGSPTRGEGEATMPADSPPTEAPPDPLCDNQLIHRDGSWCNAEVGPVVNPGVVQMIPFRLWLYDAVQGWLPWRVVRVLTGGSRKDTVRTRLPRPSVLEWVEGVTETPLDAGIIHYGARYVMVNCIQAVAFQMLEFPCDEDAPEYTVSIAVDDESNFL